MNSTKALSVIQQLRNRPSFKISNFLPKNRVIMFAKIKAQRRK